MMMQVFKQAVHVVYFANGYHLQHFFRTPISQAPMVAPGLLVFREPLIEFLKVSMLGKIKIIAGHTE